MVLEAPVEDITKTSQRTGQPINSKHYDMKSGFESDRTRRKNTMNVAMFENPKYAQYLKQNLFQKVPHKFEIILQDSDLNYKQLVELSGDNPETITIIMANIGDDPLTPWIMGHRIGHIYHWRLKSHPGYTRETPHSRYIQSLHEGEGIYSIVTELVSIIDPECDVFTTDNMNVDHHEEIFTKLSPFKSARDGNTNGVLEYITELHAQYLTTGRVDFNKDLPHWKEYSDRATKYMRGYYDSLKGMWGSMGDNLDKY